MDFLSLGISRLISFQDFFTSVFRHLFVGTIMLGARC